jgi:hypothetical protein
MEIVEVMDFFMASYKKTDKNLHAKVRKECFENKKGKKRANCFAYVKYAVLAANNVSKCSLV